MKLPLEWDGRGQCLHVSRRTSFLIYAFVERHTGGYLPLSVVMTTDKVYEAFYADEVARGFLHSHSYTGNPLACRAALATLDIFAEDDVLSANRAKSAYFNQAAEPLRRYPKVQHFRNTGMIWRSK